jgi:membrane-bound metal-dependent hydrolase YbcI (DUF457 family)
LFKVLLLENGNKWALKPFMVAGILGTTLHILLDSPLYVDIQPFYPIRMNPFYNPVLSSEIYILCVWLAIAGVAYYAGLQILLIYQKLSAHKRLTQPRG